MLMVVVFGQHRAKMFEQREIIGDAKGCDKDATAIRVWGSLKELTDA
jgi:hypothetical protein